jgi:DNA-damage-inducible protein J
MAKTAMITARVEPELKANAEKVLKRLGISTTEAISLFLSQIRLQKGLPFDVKIPNKTTLETFRKTDEGKEINEYKSVDDFVKKMRS